MEKLRNYSDKPTAFRDNVYRTFYWNYLISRRPKNVIIAFITRNLIKQQQPVHKYALYYPILYNDAIPIEAYVILFCWGCIMFHVLLPRPGTI